MSLLIVTCANTSLADAMVAVELEPMRWICVCAEPAARDGRAGGGIVPRLPAKIEKIGVFVDATVDEIAASVEAAGLTGVQLHWDVTAAETAKLRARFGQRLRILRVVHFEAGVAERGCRRAGCKCRCNPDRFAHGNGDGRYRQGV